MARPAAFPSHGLLAGMLLTLAACGAPPGQQAASGNDGAAPDAASGAISAGGGAPAPDPAPANVTPAPDSAAQSARTCRNVSPATRPPCNVANSCAIMQDEIARSCALFDGKGEPMDGCGPDPKGMAAAADVVKRYYAALNARDYGTAWAQWGNDGPPDQTMERFRAGFADTRSTQVTIGRMEPGDAGAGSVYQTVPVKVDAVLKDGKRQRFAGRYVVRRVNDVDGASADQRRWHIDSAQLKPVG